MRSPTHARSATTACRPRRTGSSLPRVRSSARRRSKRACAMRTCSLTASATTPTATGRTFAGCSDMVKGPESQWCSLSCGCHPNCGVGTALMINKETKEWAPVPRFLDAVQLTKDVTDITDAARGKNFSNFMMAMALLKNYKPFQGPKGLKLYDLFKKFDKTWALTKGAEKKYGKTSPDRTYEDAMRRRQTDPWNFLFIAGMWFQDLFNYDFRRTEMCIIPYATQQGEISFCAYNTG